MNNCYSRFGLATIGHSVKAFIIVAPLLNCSSAFADETTLYRFADSRQGWQPMGPLVFDRQGALYGATMLGGAFGMGAVFQLTPPVAPATDWTAKAIANFTHLDGFAPTAGLTIDGSGALYGLLSRGGAKAAGAIFKLTPPVAPATDWTLSKIYDFKGGVESYPTGGLLLDGDSLIGTTESGIVYKLSPPCGDAKTQWSFEKLYRFTNAAGGSFPISGLIKDRTGSLYGTTLYGGTGIGAMGTVYRLDPPASSAGGWKRTTIYTFRGDAEGSRPVSRLVLDSRGALYGVAQAGGKANAGIAYKLTPPTAPSNGWSKTIIAEFDGRNGAAPWSNSLVIDDTTGVIYGTTPLGGFANMGVVYKIQQSRESGYRLKQVHSFSGGSSGAKPNSGLIFDSQGALYGVTAEGGGFGTVFKVVEERRHR